MNRFAHKVFAITGTLDRYSRAEATHIIKLGGGTVSPVVTGRVSYLITGKKPGSKLDKARDLQISVISEKGFYNWVDDFNRGPDKPVTPQVKKVSMNIRKMMNENSNISNSIR